MRTSNLCSLVFSTLLALTSCTSDGDGFGQPSTTTTDGLNRDTSPDPADTADTASSGDTSGGESGGSGVETGDSSSGDTGPDIEGTGYEVGDIAYNLVANDQDGDPWRLWANYGSVVVLVFGDAYEGNFQSIAGFLDTLESDYSDEGVVFAAGMILGADTAPADEKDAEQFAIAYDLETVLVIEDVTDQVNWASVRPIVYVIDAEMNISKTGNNIVYETELESWIQAAL